MRYALDASALLVLINAETGAERLEPLLASHEAVVSSVNLAEVVAKLCDWSAPAALVDAVVAEFAPCTVAFDAEQARRCGELRAATRATGLSLGDRACLALAACHGLTAVTADRAWGALDIGIGIELLR